MSNHLSIVLAVVLVNAYSSLPAGDGPVHMVAPEGDGAKFWPRWRGPSGQGIVPQGDYPDTWSATENVLWKVPVAGSGNSSPIVWGDKIYLTSWFDGGGKRVIQCFDRAKGTKLWESGPEPADSDRVQGKNGWASATPCTDGERVYVYFGNHGLYACDLEGKKAWHVKFPRIDTLHGPGGTQLLYKDKVIVFQDCRKPGGFVAAFDKKTGRELWKVARKEIVGWGTPIAITSHGKDQIIVSSQDRVYAYDPENGDVIWTCAGNLYEVIPTPVAGQGLVFCASGRSGPTLAIQPDGNGDVTKTHLKWRTLKGSPFVPSPLLYGDKLYTINDILSIVQCFDAKTGHLHWQERCGEPVKEGISASPIGVNGKVFVTNEKGETFVLANDAKFSLLHVNRIGEKTLASPALVDGKWYLRTQNHLWCIGKK